MNAKLGDSLGVDFWTAKSKYGATIQTALDYAISHDAKNEGYSNLIPHVAAVAAAYGDPKGKYQKFLNKYMGDYQTKPFWFYNQAQALTKAPTNKKKSSLVKAQEDRSNDNGDSPDTDDDGDGSGAGPATPVGPHPKIPFTCPEVFKETTKVEIDNGIFVTCEDLQPMYEADVPSIDAPEAPDTEQ